MEFWRQAGNEWGLFTWQLPWGHFPVCDDIMVQCVHGESPLGQNEPKFAPGVHLSDDDRVVPSLGRQFASPRGQVGNLKSAMDHEHMCCLLSSSLQEQQAFLERF